MSGWADRKKRHEEMLRGQGKHEALLLECKLREHRHPFRDSQQIKFMEREKKKIENELIKIRQTIHHERKNPRAMALSTRSLTMEAVEPSRRHSFSARSPFVPVNSVSPRRVTNTRLSLDPSLLATTDRLLPGRRTSCTNSRDDLTKEDESGVSQLRGINEEVGEMPIIHVSEPVKSDTVDNAVVLTADNQASQNTDGSVDITTAPIAEETPGSTVKESLTEEILTNAPAVSNWTESARDKAGQTFLSVPVQRLCRRQPTLMQGRQPTFINRSNTYIKKRRELSNSLDVLSCANYKEMRQGIANETLKKLGLM